MKMITTNDANEKKKPKCKYAFEFCENGKHKMLKRTEMKKKGSRRRMERKEKCTEFSPF